MTKERKSFNEYQRINAPWRANDFAKIEVKDVSRWQGNSKTTSISIVLERHNSPFRRINREKSSGKGARLEHVSQMD
jgi:hypothetical protein